MTFQTNDWLNIKNPFDKNSLLFRFEFRINFVSDFSMQTMSCVTKRLKT